VLSQRGSASASLTLDAELYRASGDVAPGAGAQFAIAPLVSAARLAAPETVSPCVVRARVAKPSAVGGAGKAAFLTVRASGPASGRVMLFERDNDRKPWRILAPIGDAAAAQWRLPLPALTGDTNNITATFGIAATPFRAPNASNQAATMGNEFTLTVGLEDGSDLEGSVARLVCRAVPVLLASSLDIADEIFIILNALSAKVASDLKNILADVRDNNGKKTPVRVTSLGGGAVPHDLWMQDTVEFGVAPTPDGKTGVRQTVAPLLGLRAKHDGIKTAPLDAFVADYLRAREAKDDIVCVQAAVARENTRWIDWYGNLEVSPPCRDQKTGRAFPHGRILTGRQKELGFHPDLLAFLEAQELQWPPLVLDVSWLTIGHVDELVNFVPAPGKPGFRALVPSPFAARDLLRQVVEGGKGERGTPETPVFAGTKSQTTAGALLARIEKSDESRKIEDSVRETRARLCDGLGIRDADILALPVLFEDGLAVIPNAVNSLVVGKTVVVPAPHGPADARTGEDVWAHAIRERLEPLGLSVRFLDIWEPYHTRSGEIHCGTNAIRRLRDGRWWR